MNATVIAFPRVSRHPRTELVLMRQAFERHQRETGRRDHSVAELLRLQIEFIARLRGGNQS